MSSERPARAGARVGSGGMGELWQAFDLKLRVEVVFALVRPDRVSSEELRDLLRSEVRVAPEVAELGNVARRV